MKYIELTKGMSTQVDDNDFEWLNQFTWYCSSENYAACNTGDNRGNKKRKHFYMHRLILNAPKGTDIDHINMNRLDNRRENLRLVTRSQNMMNQKSHPNTSSKYKGVSLYKRDQTWQVRVGHNYIGRFKTEHQAAMAYDLWAKDMFGDKARLNF